MTHHFQYLPVKEPIAFAEFVREGVRHWVSKVTGYNQRKKEFNEEREQDKNY